jgi:hypothetical protein
MMNGDENNIDVRRQNVREKAEDTNNFRQGPRRRGQLNKATKILGWNFLSLSFFVVQSSTKECTCHPEMIGNI